MPDAERVSGGEPVRLPVAHGFARADVPGPTRLFYRDDHDVAELTVFAQLTGQPAPDGPGKDVAVRLTGQLTRDKPPDDGPGREHQHDPGNGPGRLIGLRHEQHDPGNEPGQLIGLRHEQHDPGNEPGQLIGLRHEQHDPGNGPGRPSGIGRVRGQSGGQPRGLALAARP
jgi:hypothetical protein